MATLREDDEAEEGAEVEGDVLGRREGGGGGIEIGGCQKRTHVTTRDHI